MTQNEHFELSKTLRAQAIEAGGSDLDELAIGSGYHSWTHLISQAVFQASPRKPLPQLPTALAVNPVLPKHFRSKPLEERSKAELDQWWDVPFAESDDAGKLVVYALSGGSWDRPTCLGVADDYPAAVRLASLKLEAWRAQRSMVRILVDDGIRCTVFIGAQRPDWEDTIIATGVPLEEAQAFAGDAVALVAQTALQRDAD